MTTTKRSGCLGFILGLFNRESLPSEYDLFPIISNGSLDADTREAAINKLCKILTKRPNLPTDERVVNVLKGMSFPQSPSDGVLVFAAREALTLWGEKDFVQGVEFLFANKFDALQQLPSETVAKVAARAGDAMMNASGDEGNVLVYILGELASRHIPWAQEYLSDASSKHKDPLMRQAAKDERRRRKLGGSYQ